MANKNKIGKQILNRLQDLHDRNLRLKYFDKAKLNLELKLQEDLLDSQLEFLEDEKYLILLRIPSTGVITLVGITSKGTTLVETKGDIFPTENSLWSKILKYVLPLITIIQFIKPEEGMPDNWVIVIFVFSLIIYWHFIDKIICFFTQRFNNLKKKITKKRG